MSGSNTLPVVGHDTEESDMLSAGMNSLTDLLDKHAGLVSGETEAAAMTMSQQLHDLRELISNLLKQQPENPGLKVALQMATDVQMGLQYQDRVRQQIDVIRTGIVALSEAHPPPNQDENTWLQEQLERLSGSYVMQDQWDIHHRHLGIEIDESDDDDDMMFF